MPSADPEAEERLRSQAEGLERQRRLTQEPTLALGISRWKRPAVAALLGAGEPDAAPLRFASRFSWRRAVAQAVDRQERVVVWATRMPPDLAEICDRLGLTLWRMEDGFLRSAGLGSNLIPPLSVSLDRSGIYYDARGPSDLETMLATEQPDAALLARARDLAAVLERHQINKYNDSAPQTALDLDLPRGREVVLVVGQVEDDQSILTASPLIGSNLGLLQAAREEHPKAFLLYKPHPDVVAGNRRGRVPEAAVRRLANRLVGRVAITQLLQRIDCLHTLTSLAGFEALLRGKRVHVWGMPFYAGWGLTQDALHCGRRGRSLAAEALIAFALLRYPLYLDPATGRACPPETLVMRLVAGYEDPSRRSVGRQLAVAALRLARLATGRN